MTTVITAIFAADLETRQSAKQKIIDKNNKRNDEDKFCLSSNTDVNCK